VPQISTRRPLLEDGDGKMRRLWCYNVPKLEECRASFAELVGQEIDWPGDE